MNAKTVLVTGANGFIGHHLCRQLLEDNFTVLALSRSTHPNRLVSLMKNPNFISLTGDIADKPFLETLPEKYHIDAVMHLAITNSQRRINRHNHIDLRRTDEYRINFEGTANLLQSLSESNLKIWIQSSTMSVYDFENPHYLPIDEGHPVNPKQVYGLTKLLAEELCKYYCALYGFKIIILRYSGIYGTGKESGIISRFSKHFLSNNSESLRAVENRTTDFVYVGDVVDANILALHKVCNHDGADLNTKEATKRADMIQPIVLNIGSGQEVSPFDVARLIRDHLGLNAQIIGGSAEKSRKFYYDIAKAREFLGYNPRSLHEGLSKYLEDLRERQI